MRSQKSDDIEEIKSDINTNIEYAADAANTADTKTATYLQIVKLIFCLIALLATFIMSVLFCLSEHMQENVKNYVLKSLNTSIT